MADFDELQCLKEGDRASDGLPRPVIGSFLSNIGEEARQSIRPLEISHEKKKFLVIIVIIGWVNRCLIQWMEFFKILSKARVIGLRHETIKDDLPQLIALHCIRKDTIWLAVQLHGVPSWI